MRESVHEANERTEGVEEKRRERAALGSWDEGEEAKEALARRKKK
jgi:hypothetical protein